MESLASVIIVIHLMVVIALVAVVLLQRSEGGALGMGGGGSGGLMSARGAANALTRTTAILATAFFATSIILGIIAGAGSDSGSILDQIPLNERGGGEGILDQLQPGGLTEGEANDGEPQVPTSE